MALKDNGTDFVLDQPLETIGEGATYFEHYV